MLNKRFLAIFVLLASSVIGFAQNLYSVEKISQEEFDAAENSKDKYGYDFLDDSIVANDITNQIIKDARKHFDRFDSNRMDLYFDSRDYDKVFSIESLIYLKPLGIYGFTLDTLTDTILYCYDAKTGKYLGDALIPFAISNNGIMISQSGHDCDGYLDLHFYKLSEHGIKEYMSYQDKNFGIPNFMPDYNTAIEEDIPCRAFLIGDDKLYITLPLNISSGEPAYLRISYSGN